MMLLRHERGEDQVVTGTWLLHHARESTAEQEKGALWEMTLVRVDITRLATEGPVATRRRGRRIGACRRGKGEGRCPM